jgi:hypothetical protein
MNDITKAPPRNTNHPRATRLGVLCIALCGLLTTFCSAGTDSPGLTADAPSSLAGTIAFVQNAEHLTTWGTSNAASFASPNHAGNLVIVSVMFTAGALESLTDSRGNAYVAATSLAQSQGGNFERIFYAKNVRHGANTVTATFSTSARSVVYVHEYSGADTTAPLDVTATATGPAGIAPTSGAVTTRFAKELLFGAILADSEISGATSGFTIRGTADGNLTEDRVVSTIGSYSAGAQSANQGWAAQLATFKAASAPSDAGIDTGTPDSSPMDSGPPDSTAPDGATTDAGAPDSGTHDGGDAGGGHSYSTTFSVPENPISEGGRWINGGAAGAGLWYDIKTTAGYAQSAQPSTASGFDDATAILTGTWGPDQTVTIVAKEPSVLGGTQEVEIRLRTSISAGSITGYEVDFTKGGLCLVRWNGRGPFTSTYGWTTLACYNYKWTGGVTLKASIVGTVITVWANGGQIGSYDTANDKAPTDGSGGAARYSNGNPGIGVDINSVSASTDFGITSFTATDQ